MDEEIYSPNLKKIRQTLGISVAKLSEKLNMPASTLTQYERGIRTPSFQLFAQLNKNLNINLNWFVTGEGEMFNQKIVKNITDELTIRVSNIEKILKKQGFFSF